MFFPGGRTRRRQKNGQVAILSAESYGFGLCPNPRGLGASFQNFRLGGPLGILGLADARLGNLKAERKPTRTLHFLDITGLPGTQSHATCPGDGAGAASARLAEAGFFPSSVDSGPPKFLVPGPWVTGTNVH